MPTRSELGAQADYLRHLLKPTYLARHGRAYLLNAVGGRRYRRLSERELLATRKSDTAFLFGSGRSLLEITPEEWGRIAEYETISFREFPRQRWVRADYHVTAEIDDVEGYARRIRENPLYRETVFVVQKGWLARGGNELVGRGLLPPGARVFRFSRATRGIDEPPSRSFARGLVHGWSSAISVVNFAVLMGFRRIVLAGVDLYDKGYFWLGEGERRAYEKPGAAAGFPGAERIVAMLGGWHDLLEPEGIRLQVQNPRSLLAARLPVFDWNGT